ncbi:MAG: sensor histidine kinase [Paracraurococcus sp.]
MPRRHAGHRSGIGDATGDRGTRKTAAPADAGIAAAAGPEAATDLRAVVVFGILLGLLSGGLLIGTWRLSGLAKGAAGPNPGPTVGRSAFLLAWACFCLLTALGGMLFALRDRTPPAVPIIGANVTMLLATSLFWTGARWLRGATVRPWMIGLAPAVWLAACAIPAFYDTLAARVVTGGLLFAALEWATAVELLRWRPAGALPQTGRVLAGLAILCGGAHLARVVLMTLDRADLSFVLIALSTAVLLLATGIGGVALAGEQAEARDATALQAGRAEVERLHTGLPAVIFLRDVAADGTSRLLYRGGDTDAVLGWPAEILAQQGSLEAYVEPGGISLPAIGRTVLRDGSFNGDWRMRQPDDSWRWLRTRARRLSLRPDGSGEMVGYLVNITAEREAQDRAVAAARLASLGEMAAGLAHEMRQPLSVITLALGNAQRALARGDLPAVAPRLERAIDQAARAGTLIEHLRRFARGAEPHAAVAPVAVDAAVDGALALVGGALREAEVALDVALGTPPPRVLGHLVPLEQVLVNLLANARDAMAGLPAGTARGLRIAAATEGGTVRLTVADTGGGIPIEVMARLFQPFVSTKGPEHGTGLGLSICQAMIMAMGGTIQAENGPAGAVFTLRLPAAAADCPAAVDAAC